MIPNVQQLHKEHPRAGNAFDEFNVIRWPYEITPDPRDNTWYATSAFIRRMAAYN